MKSRRFVHALTVVLVLTLAFTGLASAQATVVAVEPSAQQIYLGDQTTVEIWANEVTNFYGAQFTLDFDDTIVDGVSVEPGSAFTDFTDEYQVAQADIISGTVSFAATLLRVAKAGPLQGNIQLAIITFDALDVGISPLTFGQVELSDSYGEPILFTVADGEIEVLEEPTILTGNAYLEGRSDHSGILVTLLSSPVMTTTTDAAGVYTFDNIAAGVYSVTMSADLYLDAMATDIVADPHVTNYACDVTLLGGDLNNDDVIDILDLSLCAVNFETTDPAADVNGDGIVNIYDLVLVGKNFKLASPTTVSCTL